MDGSNSGGSDHEEETASDAAQTPATLDFSIDNLEELQPDEGGDVTKMDNENNSDSQRGSDDDDNESDDDDEDEDEAAAAAGLSVSEREILTLLAVDKKLASVLELAADALSALKIPEANSTEAPVPTLSLDERATAFENSAAEYYKALDDIQLTLRNSIQVIRKSRISPRILLDNPNAASSRTGPIGLGSIPKSSGGAVEDDGLSKGARRMETKIWADALAALKKMLPGDARQQDGSVKKEEELADNGSPIDMG